MTAASRFGLCVGLVCMVGCEAGVSEYDRGYGQGTAEVRQIRKEKGWEAEIGLQVMDAFRYLPVHEGKSADWNAGYQKGVQDEIRR